MLQLFLPPSLRRFTPVYLGPGSSVHHVALAYDLVEALRPGLVVDLGTESATSFFAYCQSMHEHDVDGSCYAIDDWPKEARGNKASFDDVNDHGRANYPGIYYVLRMKPRKALAQFGENSIDLLSINGTRADVVTDGDVEAWHARVRPGGLVAWQGANPGLGPWSAFASRCSAVTFGHGGGMGLAMKMGATPASQLLRMLFVEDEAEEVERFYRHVDEHHQLKRILTKMRAGPKPAK